jgi:hypothetical protein
LELSWEDPRLYYEDNLGHEDFLKLDPAAVWTPDLIYLDPQAKPDPIDESMELFDYGLVFHSRNYLCAFSQNFDVHNFPFDSQVLIIRVDSFGYSEMQINFTFAEEAGPFLDPSFEFFDSALWKLIGIEAEVYPTGFQYMISVKREPGPYIVKFIVPLVLIGVAAWMSFFITTTNDTGARATFTISLLLASIGMTYVISPEIPKVWLDDEESNNRSTI